MKIFDSFKFVIALLFLMGCNNADLKEPVEYNGPVSELENVETYYTERDIINVKFKAPLLYEFKNQDRECPKGIYMEFYDENGKLETTLRANHAYFFNEQKQWRGRGDVEVKNVQKNEQLNTEELFWKQADKRIYTDKFVTIRQQGDVLYGHGLDAKEDMSDYTITDLEGTIEVNE